MKTRLYFLFVFLIAFSSSVLAEVILLVVPSKMSVEPGESIDLDVYLKNTGTEVVKVPNAKIVDGYSYCGVYLRTIRYKIEGEIVNEVGKVTNDKILLGFTQDLNPNATQRYRFKYNIPPKQKDFDFETLDVVLRISKEGKRATITLLKSESGRREVLTPAPHTTGHTDP